MRKLIFIFLVLAVLAATAAGMLLHDWKSFRQQPLNPDGPVQLWLAEGSSFRSMVRQLEALGLTRLDWRWRLLGRLQAPALKAGEYRIHQAASVDELVALLESGRVRRHQFTIVEGWSVAELRAALAADSRLQHRTGELDEEQLMAKLDCAECPAEGWFLPESYHFTRPASDFSLLQRAHRAMKELLGQTWVERAPGLPLDDAYQLLVLASLIERETGLDPERKLVAGVFVRRLAQGMRLQTDPTVIYGPGDEFSGRLTRAKLRTDHAWNTYTRSGLPPTSIALPGQASLRAAAHPAYGPQLYFVSRGDGSHHFSATLEENNAAVNRYIRRLGQ